MTFELKQPKYVIPCTQFGTVYYPELNAVGFQFPDPSDDHVFASIDGRLMPRIAKDIQELIAMHPEILKWSPLE